MAVIPTESQLRGKGVIFSYARICCTHTHTQASHLACCCTASTAVHMSKALWIHVSQWGCCWHLELGNSLLYKNVLYIASCLLSQAPAD